MHCVDVLEEAIQIAKSSGFEVRHEWLAETAGGPCRIGTKHVLFVDLSLTADEQLSQVLDGLRSCEQLKLSDSTSTVLQRLLHSD